MPKSNKNPTSESNVNAKKYQKNTPKVQKKTKISIKPK